ncbi:DUF7093 family protein [Halococcus salsus]|uniref:DUF7093 family protein n=1 Tax=Halococcus salsus TaxID=2162894 RepID=UPI001357E564|nr:hypothetical protein [Halococcus salsus]
MGVMCSLLGHDYDDPEVERERVENGDEVVLTAKRVERCRSCGHERVISENTEVTALSAAAGVVREPDGTVVIAPDGSEAGTDDTADDPDRTVTAVETMEDDPADAEPEPTVRNGGPRGVVEAEPDETEPTDATEPTDGTERAIRDDGAADDDPAPDPAGSGSVEIAESVVATSALDRSTGGGEPADDQGDDTGSIDRIGDEPTRRDPSERAPGEWPSEPSGPVTTEAARSDGSAASTAQWPDGSGRDGESADEGSDEEPDQPDRLTGGSFVCTSCGFDAAVIDSPHRAGDICPNCHRGYLAWETRKG